MADAVLSAQDASKAQNLLPHDGARRSGKWRQLRHLLAGDKPSLST